MRAFPVFLVLSDAERWTQHKGMNCYSGRGGTDLDSGHGCGTMSLAACQAKCDALPGCTAITVESRASGDITCCRRSNIDLAACASGGYDTWTKSSAPPPVPPPPTPASADLCAGVADTCSPAICNLKPHTTVHLEARTYYLDRQVWLPPGAHVIGKGPGKTIIKACGEHLSPAIIKQDKAADVLGGCNSYTEAVGGKSSGRRGFMLGNNTYVGNFTIHGRDGGRVGLGSAPIETPGCWGAHGCAAECLGRDGTECNGQCAGVSNAVAEDIEVAPYTFGHALWMPRTPNGTKGCENITIRNVKAHGTWADGMNVHGPHKRVTIDGASVRYAGDDCLGVWGGSQGLGMTDFVVRGSEFSVCKYNPTPNDNRSQDCVACDKSCPLGSSACIAVYGSGEGLKVVDNKCSGGWGFLSLSSSFAAVYPNDLTAVVRGNAFEDLPGGTGCAGAGSVICTNKADVKTTGGQKGCDAA